MSLTMTIFMVKTHDSSSPPHSLALTNSKGVLGPILPWVSILRRLAPVIMNNYCTKVFLLFSRFFFWKLETFLRPRNQKLITGKRNLKNFRGYGGSWWLNRIKVKCECPCGSCGSKLLQAGQKATQLQKYLVSYTTDKVLKFGNQKLPTNKKKITPLFRPPAFTNPNGHARLLC